MYIHPLPPTTLFQVEMHDVALIVTSSAAAVLCDNSQWRGACAMRVLTGPEGGDGGARQAGTGRKTRAPGTQRRGGSQRQCHRWPAGLSGSPWSPWAARSARAQSEFRVHCMTRAARACRLPWRNNKGHAWVVGTYRVVWQGLANLLSMALTT